MDARPPLATFASIVSPWHCCFARIAFFWQERMGVNVIQNVTFLAVYLVTDEDAFQKETLILLHKYSVSHEVPLSAFNFTL